MAEAGNQALTHEFLRLHGLLMGQMHGHLGVMGREMVGDLGQERAGLGRRVQGVDAPEPSILECACIRFAHMMVCEHSLENEHRCPLGGSNVAPGRKVCAPRPQSQTSVSDLAYSFNAAVAAALVIEKC